jgi:GNAT superfamily N-acetyltransferase
VGGSMTRSDVRDPDRVAEASPSSSDWLVLRQAVITSLDTSPDAFLATIDKVRAEKSEFWQEKLRSAEWAVVQHDRQTLGIAAALLPGETDYYAFSDKARFIESVWIAPKWRKHGVGLRLVTYLIEQQRQMGIQEFYLWVLNHNNPAIRLYDRMNFKQTGQVSDLPETQFLLKFDSDVVDDEESQRNFLAREDDRRLLGITYRMLSAGPSGQLPQWK